VAAQTFANSRQVHPAAQSMRAIFSDVFAPRKDRQIDHCACPTIFFHCRQASARSIACDRNL